MGGDRDRTGGVKSEGGTWCHVGFAVGYDLTGHSATCAEKSTAWAMGWRLKMV